MDKMTQPDQKPPPRNDMSAITEVLEYANAINCKSAFQPTIAAARAELTTMRDELERVKGDINGLIADRDKYKDAADTLEAQAGAKTTQFNDLKLRHERLVVRAEKLLHECELADNHEDLTEYVKGDTMHDLSKALSQCVGHAALSQSEPTPRNG